MQKLISSANFYIQAESLRLLFELLTTRDHASFRDLWLREPQSMKTVILAMQSRNKTVRKEALNIFEMFLDNPNNSQAVREFIKRNRDKLVSWGTFRKFLEKFFFFLKFFFNSKVSQIHFLFLFKKIEK